MCNNTPMKAYPVELRERIVGFVENGGSKADAAARFKVGRRTVYRYLGAARGGSLAPKPQPGRRKAFADESLRLAVKARPSATLETHAKEFGVSRNAIWKRLRQLRISLKKTDPLPGEGRVPEVAVHPVAAGRCGRGRPRVLPRRVRR